MRIETADALIVGNPESEDSAVVFFDLLCPHCKRCFHDVVRALARHDRDFHVVYKHWPLDTDCNQELPSTVHPGACVAATAATAAATRGKAGEAIVYLFDQVAMFPQVVDKLGETIVGMPKNEWRALLRSRRVQRTVARDIAEGNELGLERVPAVFLNGRPVDCARIGALLERLK